MEAADYIRTLVGTAADMSALCVGPDVIALCAAAVAGGACALCCQALMPPPPRALGARVAPGDAADGGATAADGARWAGAEPVDAAPAATAVNPGAPCAVVAGAVVDPQPPSAASGWVWWSRPKSD